MGLGDFENFIKISDPQDIKVKLGVAHHWEPVVLINSDQRLVIVGDYSIPGGQKLRFLRFW